MSTRPPHSQLRTPGRARWAQAAFAAAALLLLLGSCTDNKPAPKEQRLLVIDGIEIRIDELKPYTDFLTESHPEAGEKTKNIWAMRDHVLPLRVAQRTFPKERAEQLKLAQGLREVATSVGELEQHSTLIEHKVRKKLTRSSAKLPVAIFLFKQLNTFAASPPLELPQGYFVVGSYEFKEQPLILADYCDALQVGFVTHTGQAWSEFWEKEKVRIGAKVTFVHPDYRDNLPAWMKPPKDNKKP